MKTAKKSFEQRINDAIDELKNAFIEHDIKNDWNAYYRKVLRIDPNNSFPSEISIDQILLADEIAKKHFQDYTVEVVYYYNRIMIEITAKC